MVSDIIQANGDQDQDYKKPRRSERIANSQSDLAAQHKAYLPSPLTHQDSTATEINKETTATPPAGRPSQIRHHTPVTEALHVFSSPPGDTQALSQYPPAAFAPGVDEAEEGVWGYLFPLDNRFGDSLVLKKRDSCSSPANACRSSKRGRKKACAHETPGGYLVGRHPECGQYTQLCSLFTADIFQTSNSKFQRYRTGIA